ncbi:MAG: restriction endonuclease subunit S [Thermoanaerobaculia bacterium]|nr:restriction endonuclease subunit S [Thermoanaerobaculia bacterium]
MTEEEELPEGWTPYTLESLLEPGGLFDGPFGSNLKTSDYTESGVRVVRLENLSNLRFIEEKRTYVSREKYQSLKKHTVRSGDLLFGSFLDDAVRVAILPKLPTPAIAKADCFCIRARRDLVDPRFLMFRLGATETKDALIEQIHGATRPRVTTRQLRGLRIGLPPVSEQQRIAAKIETTIASVTGVEARLASFNAMLRRFRQTILAAACDGRLTDRWREEHRPREAPDRLVERIGTARAAERRGQASAPIPAEFDVPLSWPVVSMDALTTAITSGSRAWSRYYRDDGSGTFIMAQNIRPLSFDRTYRLAVAPPRNDPERARTAVLRGDILVTIVGANTGDVCRVDSDLKEHYVCQSVAYMRPVLPDLSHFLELWLNSPVHGRAQYKEWLYGEGRPHLSLDHLRETAVAVPSLEEQREIVRRVKALFALADAIEKRVAAASARADKLTQAILAKAFRGELVPTEAELNRRREVAAATPPPADRPAAARPAPRRSR